MEQMSVELKLHRSCKERFKPVMEAIHQIIATKKERILIAIDGKCASGKTTLSTYLQKKFDCNLFHMDDFFLQNHQRTDERLKEVGGNVDYERFHTEVLIPLLSGRPLKYRKFDCTVRRISQEFDISPKRLNIVEGSYSQHPYFQKPYDLCIFLDIDDDSQIENIKSRNGLEKLELFQSKWIPMENEYFEKYKIKETSMVVPWNKPIFAE